MQYTLTTQYVQVPRGRHVLVEHHGEHPGEHHGEHPGEHHGEHPGDHHGEHPGEHLVEHHFFMLPYLHASTSDEQVARSNVLIRIPKL